MNVVGVDLCDIEEGAGVEACNLDFHLGDGCIILLYPHGVEAFV